LRDREVVRALRLGDAIAIQLDVDGDKEVARQLSIRAMPTLIAFRDGAEVDRVVGAKKSKDLLAWLDGLARGRTALDAVRDEVARTPDDMQIRLQYARMLSHHGRFDDATAEHVWLWQHMLAHEPSMVGVRLSFFVGDIERLVGAHPPARAAFVALRDDVAPAGVAAVGTPEFADWMALNRALRESHRVVAWFDEVRDRLPDTPQTERFVDAIIWQLTAAGRWADAGALMRDRVASIAGTARFYLDEDRLAGMPPEHREMARDGARRQVRRTAAATVRALTAAGRGDDAAAVAAEARRIDGSTEMSTALDEAARAGAIED
jgi:hypothetical protein